MLTTFFLTAIAAITGKLGSHEERYRDVNISDDVRGAVDDTVYI